MLVTRALPANTNLLALHRAAPRRYRLLLESVAHGSAHARWDMLLMADPHAEPLVAGESDFLSALDAAWCRERQPHPAAVSEAQCLPFRGGWALFVSYELAAQVEPVLRLPPAGGLLSNGVPLDGAPLDSILPTAIAIRCPAAVLRNRDTGLCVAVAEAPAAGLLECIADDVAVAMRNMAVEVVPPEFTAPIALLEDAPEDFLAGVRRVLDYLRAGDVFQVNLSRGWTARFDHAIDPAALYARLRQANPAPFAGLFAGDGWAVVSASPERLVSVRGQVVETRPIAGTRPRIAGDDDSARIRDLIGHPKERAEHVMLVDLERNDLGRVCVPGSVVVDELMSVESYAHVHHIVSNVRGRLRDDVTPGATIRAVFPGGTITGAPKVRCMQIIAELEGVGRGAYTGAIGWLNRDGDLDLNILIRSAVVEDGASGGSVLQFRTGAGIVADSDPQHELDETRAKARGMLQALSPAGAMLCASLAETTATPAPSAVAVS